MKTCTKIVSLLYVGLPLCALSQSFYGRITALPNSQPAYNTSECQGVELSPEETQEIHEALKDAPELKLWNAELPAASGLERA